MGALGSGLALCLVAWLGVCSGREAEPGPSAVWDSLRPGAVAMGKPLSVMVLMMPKPILQEHHIVINSGPLLKQGGSDVFRIFQC